MSPTFSHGKSFFQGRHFKPAGRMHGATVRQETTKKGCFTTAERTRLGLILFGDAFEKMGINRVPKSVFEMKKSEIELAISIERPLRLGNRLGSLEQKLQERFEKIKADEASQRQGRNQ